MNRPEFQIFVPELTIVGCPECQENMEPQWESRRLLPDGTIEVSTVCHCWNCDYDKEVIRIYKMNGRIVRTEERRFFFG
jgi:hypothetical protein